MARLAVLISGNGSNLQAILDAIRSRILDASVVLVVSNRRDAFGLERAQKAGIPTEYHPLKPYRDEGKSRIEYDAELARLVRGYNPDWVVLAGWMHILSNAFLRHFPYRVLNLHPALPGKFPGANAIDDALAAFARGEIHETGVMVHLVPDEQVDSGPVIEVQRVPIYPRDTAELLRNRIQQTEHRVLIQALLRLTMGDEEEDQD
jgi:formyltetrahydrofolate-dependent phosphoribosylglycinamide formyltransferase